MYSSTIAAVLLAVSTAQAALNGACTASGKPGVCISTNDCTADGGSYVSGACPNDAENIKCCYKSCGSGGTCRFTSSCSGTTQTGLCPGPTDFKCCLPSGGGSSSVPWPKANCQATAINSGERILAQFPGKVSQVWCYANKPNSDHATGMALDFMVGLDSPNGRLIAEWVMNNHAALNVKYIIWTQKIWNSNEAPKSWANWRGMEDRGDPTANHRDHPHVSFQ